MLSRAVLRLAGFAALWTLAAPPQPPSPTPAKATAAKTASATAPAPAAGAKGSAGPAGPVEVRPAIKLLAPGQDPKRALRFHFKAGDKQRATMTMSMETAAVAGGASQPPVKIAMNARIEESVLEVAADGSARCEFKYAKFSGTVGGFNDLKRNGAGKDAGKGPGQDAGKGPGQDAGKQLEAKLKAVEGLSGTMRLDQRGFVADASLRVPEGVDPQMGQVMQGMTQAVTQLSVPFPEEPVGIGARWEVRSRLEQGGVTINQVATYDLAALAGDVVTLKIKMSQSADPKAAAAGAPAGMEVRLDGRVEGETKLSLAHPVPLASKAVGSNDMHLGPAGQGMSMKMRTAMTLRSK